MPREPFDTDLDQLFAPGNQAVLDWTNSAAKYDDLRVEDHHTDAETIRVLFTALYRLKEERDRATSLIKLLVNERTTITEWIAAQSRASTQSSRLYRKVGLNEGCPDFVLLAARKAYRVALHSDRQPPHRRAEAEKRFKEAESIFEQLLTARGLC
jgi:hypothetical protein